MDEKISQFVSITGSAPDKAKFYVESARGDVEEAVSTYFETEGAQGESGEADEPSTAAAAAAASEDVASTTSGPRTLSGAPAPSLPEGWSSGGGGGGSGGKKKSTAAAASSSGPGRFASLADYRTEGPSGRGGGGDGDDDDDDDDDDDGRDPVNFFTGGERSGLSVQNPDHGRRRGAPDVVQDILQRAREMAQRRAEGGGEDVDDEDNDWGSGEGTEAKGSSGKATNKSFGGQGRSLKDDGGATQDAGQPAQTPGADASTSVPGAFELGSEGSRTAGADAEIANRRIIFWQDGFSLEDGPLCRYDDPQHAQTLAMINQGAAPLSFLNVRFGQRVNLTVEQRHEKYAPPPPPPMKPFGGSGNRLGSPVPAMTAATSSSAAPAAAAAPTAVPVTFEVDSSAPTTQLQIRLADGQRLVGRFNHSHTVGDVRSYINASHPGIASRAYVLQASFPPKPITDETQTLEQAGLINAVVIQKWT